MSDSFESLNQNRDFLRLYRRGRSCAKSALVVYAMKNRAGVCRVGITTSKKIGNAVHRNRARRVLRAAFRAVLADTALNGWDLVLVARSRTAFMKSTAVAKALRGALEEMGVIG